MHREASFDPLNREASFFLNEDKIARLDDSDLHVESDFLADQYESDKVGHGQISLTDECISVDHCQSQSAARLSKEIEIPLPGFKEQMAA